MGFWGHVANALGKPSEASAKQYPFGSFSIIPDYNRQHPESWHCWAAICLDWDENAPIDKISASWFAYRPWFDAFWTDQLIDEMFMPSNQVKLTAFREGGLRVPLVDPNAPSKLIPKEVMQPDGSLAIDCPYQRAWTFGRYNIYLGDVCCGIRSL